MALPSRGGNWGCRTDVQPVVIYHSYQPARPTHHPFLHVAAAYLVWEELCQTEALGLAVEGRTGRWRHCTPSQPLTPPSLEESGCGQGPKAGPDWVRQVRRLRVPGLQFPHLKKGDHRTHALLYGPARLHFRGAAALGSHWWAAGLQKSRVKTAGMTSVSVTDSELQEDGLTVTISAQKGVRPDEEMTARCPAGCSLTLRWTPVLRAD